MSSHSVMTELRVIPGRTLDPIGGVYSTPSMATKMFSPEPSLT